VNYVHIHSRKEIENYLLNINVLERRLKNQINIKSKRIQEDINETFNLKEYIEQVNDEDKAMKLGQNIEKRLDFNQKLGKDPSTIYHEAIRSFDL
ncbi:hypothetical protein, partial [Escherichia coli]|uniref:hypothetical protein n=1 Tax=Escherichia coli TaxID=562 RepID=UPI0015C95D29